MVLIIGLVELIELVRKYEETTNTYGYGCLGRLDGGFTGMTYEDATALYKQKWEYLQGLASIIENAIKLINKNPIEILNANEVIGTRVTTGYCGRFETVSCDVLTSIELSTAKEVGVVKLPYIIDLETHKAVLTPGHERWYRVKRIGSKVYWTITRDSLRYYTV